MPFRLIILGGLVAGLFGCGGDEDGAANAPPGGPGGGDLNMADDRAGGPPSHASYDFAAGLEREHPLVVDLLERAFDTILAGDYAAYRRLMVRTRNPEPEERFRLLHEALTHVTVTEIALVDSKFIPNYDGPAYLVRTAFEFTEESRAAEAIDARTLAILVVQEAGNWRLVVAPQRFQAEEEAAGADEPEAGAASEEPSAPEFPWDANVDY